jgi:hypothetical protein
MTTALHSPAPWEVEIADSLYNTFYIVNEERESDEVDHANARLIAAAPELLSALTKMHHFLARIEGYLQENDLWDDEEQDLLEANVAAIAKATQP